MGQRASSSITLTNIEDPQDDRFVLSKYIYFHLRCKNGYASINNSGTKCICDDERNAETFKIDTLTVLKASAHCLQNYDFTNSKPQPLARLCMISCNTLEKIPIKYSLKKKATGMVTRDIRCYWDNTFFITEFTANEVSEPEEPIYVLK